MVEQGRVKSEKLMCNKARGGQGGYLVDLDLCGFKIEKKVSRNIEAKERKIIRDSVGVKSRSPAC